MKLRLLMGIGFISLWDASLHAAQLLRLKEKHPLYPHFANALQYDAFWLLVWTVVTLAIVYILVARYDKPLERKTRPIKNAGQGIGHGVGLGARRR
jgi:hypothetical protein